MKMNKAMWDGCLLDGCLLEWLSSGWLPKVGFRKKMQ